MKRVLLILVLLLISGCGTGQVIADLPQDFAQAEEELMALASSYQVPGEPLVDSFVQEFGSVFSLKVYDTRWLILEDDFIWYTITLEGSDIKVERAAGSIRDWNFKIKANDVPDVIDSVEGLEGVSDVISLVSDIGTEPAIKRLSLISWLSENLSD